MSTANKMNRPEVASKRLPLWILIVSGVAAAITLLFIVFAARGVFATFNMYWSFGGIKRVLYQDLGFSEALSSVLATAIAFIEGIVWIPVIAWPFRILRTKFTVRQTIVALVCWIVAYGTVPLLHLGFGRDVCFNQSTGNPEKWYVTRDGKVILFDSGGFDSFGVKKEPVTEDVCEVHAQQQSGVAAKLITDTPSAVQFFDSSTGFARVWYDRGADGGIRLFDAPGYDPATGAPLTPVTKDVVASLLAANPATPQAALPVTNDATQNSPALSLPANTASSAQGPAPADESGAIQSRVLAYFAAWSEQNDVSLSSIRSFYDSTIIYYGHPMAVDVVMSQKERFAERWPVRSYTIRPATLIVDCSQGDDCIARGMLDWQASDPASGRRSVGTANFSFGFRNRLIVAEAGSVVTRNTTAAVLPTASTPLTLSAALQGAFATGQATTWSDGGKSGVVSVGEQRVWRGRPCRSYAFTTNGERSSVAIACQRSDGTWDLAGS